MPRANDKPLKCWNTSTNSPNCRFCIVVEEEGDWKRAVCQRNPTWELCEEGHGCFAGEPLVERACRTCKKRSDCIAKELLRKNVMWKWIDDKVPSRPWSCSEWEAAE